MAKYLIETTEVYRCDDENEAKRVIEEAKASSSVSKYDCVYKERKSKGEIVDYWYKVTIKKKWDEEKEPSGGTTVSYSRYEAWTGPDAVEVIDDDEE